MMKFILAMALAATAALGTLQPQTAQAASVRVFIGLNDVVFDSGIPYYRVTREPVYVVYENNSPVYYRVVSWTTYKGKAAPPPWAPAYGWRHRGERMYHGYYDVHGVWHWD